MRTLLEGATSLLRLPESPDQPPEVLPDGTGLRCSITGRSFPYRNGVQHILGERLLQAITQLLRRARWGSGDLL